jgi:hypothetical protein
MDSEKLVHSCRLDILGSEYEVLVFSRQDGSFVAKTVFSSEDVIINDGLSLEDALDRHRRLLPLAVDSRSILRAYRSRSLS